MSEGNIWNIKPSSRLTIPIVKMSSEGKIQANKTCVLRDIIPYMIWKMQRTGLLLFHDVNVF